jgi:hypothetical protein
MSSRPTWITYQDPLSKKRKEGRKGGREKSSQWKEDSTDRKREWEKVP